MTKRNIRANQGVIILDQLTNGLTLTSVGLVLIRVDSCRTRVDSC